MVVSRGQAVFLQTTYSLYFFIEEVLVPVLQFLRYTGNLPWHFCFFEPLLLELVFQFQSICIKTALDSKSSPGRHHETVLELLRSVSLEPVMKTVFFRSQMLSRLWNLMSKSSSSSASARPVWKSTEFCEP